MLTNRRIMATKTKHARRSRSSPFKYARVAAAVEKEQTCGQEWRGKEGERDVRK
jgi:hypothetical protein